MKSSFRDRFFRLACVNILSNLTVPIASLVDLACLGHLEEIHHLAGVSVATVLFNYLYWTFGFLRMGTTGTTAQARGNIKISSNSKEKDEVFKIYLRNSSIALSIGLIILILQTPLREIGFTLLSATPEVKASGIDYYSSLIWGAPATLLNFVLWGWFLGLEKGLTVLLLSLISKGSNIILDYLLIIRWGWESGGAGIATAISQYLSLLVGLICVGRLIPLKTVIRLFNNLWSKSVIREAFSLNRDILIRTFALVTTFAVFTNMSSNLGTLTLATNSLLLQIVTLAAYFIDGLAFATESLAGVSYGEKNTGKLMVLLKVSSLISVSLGLIFALVFCLFPSYLFGLLTSHQEVIVNIDNYVFWLIPVLGFGAIAYMLDGYFLGLTQGSLLRNSTLIASICGFFPLALLGWIFHNTHLLWLALAAFMFARSVTLGLAIPRTWPKY